LLSCSRDSTIKLWSVETQESKFGYFVGKNPLLSRKEHLRKVRDLKYNSRTASVATLSADGSVKIWDKNNLDVISSTELADTNELGRW